MANIYLEKIAEVLKVGGFSLSGAMAGARKVGGAIASEAKKMSPGNLRLDKEYLGTGGMLKNVAKNRVAQVGAGVAAGAMLAKNRSDK